MTYAPFPVLLLGWNDGPRPGETDVAPLTTFVAPLARLLPLAVLLPCLPERPLASGSGAHVTGLANLSLTEALTGSIVPPLPRPAAWLPPAAPYAGAARPPATPAAPYLGATVTTPISPAIAVAAPAPAAVASLRVAPAASPLAGRPPQQAAPGPLPNHANISSEPSEPAVAAAGQPQHLPNEPETARAPAKLPTAAAEPVGAGLPASEATPVAPPARMWATLTEALAALGMPLPTSADLNFQVIQYARFAIRRALHEPFAVIYAVDWPTWLAGMEIRQLTGRPLVLHVQSLAQAVGPTSGWGPALERLALRRADLVLAATEQLAQHLTERFQLPPERLRVVAPTDTATINTLLHQLTIRRPGSSDRSPLFPPTP